MTEDNLRWLQMPHIPVTLDKVAVAIPTTKKKNIATLVARFELAASVIPLGQLTFARVTPGGSPSATIADRSK
jgi:hypothetical protein